MPPGCSPIRQPQTSRPLFCVLFCRVVWSWSSVCFSQLFSGRCARIPSDSRAVRSKPLLCRGTKQSEIKKVSIMASRYFRSGEVDDIFASMDQVKATRYAHRVLSNRDSPVSNKDAVAAYMSAHPEKFLTQEQIDLDPSIMGRRSFFGGRKTRRPIAEVRSVEEISKAVSNMGTPLRRRMYLESIIDNPDTPAETRQNAKDFMNLNRDRLATDKQVEAYKARKAAEAADSDLRNRRFWSRFWKSKEDYDKMSPKEKKFFGIAFQNKNQTRTASYFLRVLTNKESSQADKDAVTKVINDNPHMVFKHYNRDWKNAPRREYSTRRE